MGKPEFSQVLRLIQIQMYGFVKHTILQTGRSRGIFKSQRGTPNEGKTSTPKEELTD